MIAAPVAAPGEWDPVFGGDNFSGGGETPGRDWSSSRPLSHPDDCKLLSPLLCFVRSHLVEAFVVTTEEEARACRHVDCRRKRDPHANRVDSGNGENDNVKGRGGVFGLVGVRCVHCVSNASSLCRPQVRGAMSYPSSIRLVHQCVRNFQRYHAAACPFMPEDIKKKYLDLKAASVAKQERSKIGISAYWKKSCELMGMIDAEDGIRLKDGRFLNAPAKSVAGTLACEGFKSAQANSATGSVEKELSTADVTPQTLHVLGCHEQDDKGHCHVHSEKFQPNGRMGNFSSEVLSQPLPQSTLDPHILEAKLGGATSVVRCNGNLSPEMVKEDVWESCNPGLQAIVPNKPDLPNHDSSPFLQPLETRAEVSSTVAEQGSTLSLGSEQQRRENISPAPSSDALLEKVKLAESVVRAAGQIRQVPPPAPGIDCDEVDKGWSDSFDMRYLGEELYELFAARNPFREEDENLNAGEGNEMNDDEGLEPEDVDPLQRRKREKRREEKKYVPLSEMGLPPSLCSLVSALLDCENEEQHNPYESILDVEEDLRLMVSRPDRFLFQAANSCLQTVSTVLFGREKEVARLLKAYDEMTNGSGIALNRMVLVAGHSGTGKSSLVHSVRDFLIRKGASFISGKFDVMRQMGPLTVIVSALDDYCDILARDADRIDHVKEAITSAVGEEGTEVLASVIPNLGKIVETVVDSQPAAISAGGEAAMQRLVFLFRMFLRAACNRAHPVVLFLDDLQWADKVTLDLMQALVVDVEIDGLLVIGSYRDNEVDADHLLTAYLDNIRISRTVDIVSVQLGNLELENVNALVSEILCVTPRATRLFAEAVLQKTGGNALFVLQFLGLLHDEGLLRFSLSSRRWEWDIDKIRGKNVADNVVELMTAKLLRLAPEVQQALSLAAAFGSQAEEKMIQIFDRAPDRVESKIAALDTAVTEGLVVKTASAYRFSHDQIQQAAYLLIPECEVENFHLKVGRCLWQWSSVEEMDSYLFVIVDQLHRGTRLITDHDEQINLANLNLLAAQKASNIYAYLPAATYLKAGIRLLTEEDWIFHRDLCFDLYNSAAETDYILREFDVMKVRWEEVLRRANTLKEKLRAYYALVRSHGGQGNAKESIDTALTVLHQLGEPFPDSVTEVTLKREVVATQNLISKRSEDALFHLVMMEDESKREAMKFLNVLMFPLFGQRHKFFPLVACRMVRLSLEYGICSESASGFAGYGMLLGGLLKDHSGGHFFGKLALSIQEKLVDKDNLAKVHLLVYAFINDWVEPIQSSLPFLKDAIRVGLATGDIAGGFTAGLAYLSSALWTGERLGPLMEEMKSFSTLMPEYKLYMPHSVSKPMQQAVMNLLGQSDDPIKLIRDENDEHLPKNNVEDGEESQFSAPDAVTKLYRMWLEYLFGEYELAWETREENQGVEEWGRSRFSVACTFSFYGGLTAIAMARNEGESKYADTIKKTISQMQVWAASSLWNCQHKLELMNAEHAYMKGDFVGAAEAYSTAVDVAAKHKFIHEEALASERAGLFYSETGAHDAASRMFLRAYNCYERWGARSKAAHVQEQYAILML